MKTMQFFRKPWQAYLSATLFLSMMVSCNEPARANAQMAQIDAPDPVASPIPPEEVKSIKLALLLDTSNSMDGLIDQAKAQLWQVVNKLSQAKCLGETPTIEIALYEYGNSRLQSETGYIRRVTDLTSDLDIISRDLFSLSTQGGDEYCGQVISTSLNDLVWDDSEDLQLIFIAGNEPFTQGSVSFADACVKARDMGIVVNTIFCGDFNEGINTSWKAGADITHGEYMSINHNSQTVFIESPYDDEITTLNTQLNNTYYGYGLVGNQRKQMQESEDDNAVSLSSDVASERAKFKSSANYSNGTWDVVDAYKADSTFYQDVDEAHLPEELQGKTDEEIVAFIEEKQEEREQIKAQIQSLSDKRDVYVAEQRTANAEGADLQLGSALLKAVESQAKLKHFEFPE